MLIIYKASLLPQGHTPRSSRKSASPRSRLHRDAAPPVRSQRWSTTRPMSVLRTAICEAHFMTQQISLMVVYSTITRFCRFHCSSKVTTYSIKQTSWTNHIDTSVIRSYVDTNFVFLPSCPSRHKRARPCWTLPTLRKKDVWHHGHVVLKCSVGVLDHRLAITISSQALVNPADPVMMALRIECYSQNCRNAMKYRSRGPNQSEHNRKKNYSSRDLTN